MEANPSPSPPGRSTPRQARRCRSARPPPLRRTGPLRRTSPLRQPLRFPRPAPCHRPASDGRCPSELGAPAHRTPGRRQEPAIELPLGAPRRGTDVSDEGGRTVLLMVVPLPRRSSTPDRSPSARGRLVEPWSGSKRRESRWEKPRSGPSTSWASRSRTLSLLSSPSPGPGCSAGCAARRGCGPASGRRSPARNGCAGLASADAQRDVPARPRRHQAPRDSARGNAPRTPTVSGAPAAAGGTHKAARRGAKMRAGARAVRERRRPPRAVGVDGDAGAPSSVRRRAGKDLVVMRGTREASGSLRSMTRAAARRRPLEGRGRMEQ